MNRPFARIACLIAVALWLPACAHYHGGYGYPRAYGHYPAHAYPRGPAYGYYGHARPEPFWHRHRHPEPDRWPGYRPPEHHRSPRGFGPPVPFAPFSGKPGHRDGGAWAGPGRPGRPRHHHHGESGPPAAAFGGFTDVRPRHNAGAWPRAGRQAGEHHPPGHGLNRQEPPMEGHPHPPRHQRKP